MPNVYIGFFIILHMIQLWGPILLGRCECVSTTRRFMIELGDIENFKSMSIFDISTIKYRDIDIDIDIKEYIGKIRKGNMIWITPVRVDFLC